MRSRSMLLSGMVAGALGAAVLVGVPAAADEVKPADPPASKTNRNDDRGGASEYGTAIAKAEASDQRVEVVSERTTTDSVFANPDGTISREQATSPIRAKGPDGKLASIDTDLARSEGRLAPKVATGEVSFSADGEGRLATYDLGDGKSVGLDFDGELGAPEVEEQVATYGLQDVEGASVRASASTDGFAADVILSERPAAVPSDDTEAPAAVEGATPAPEEMVFRFPLALDGVKASLQDNRLVVTDGDDTVVAVSRRLQMWDARRDEAGDALKRVDVDAKLVSEDGRKVLELRPSMDYLTDPETVYPVTVDPDLGPDVDNYDTYYFSGQANNDFRGDDYRMVVGSTNGTTKYRSFMRFDDNAFFGKDVTSATLRLRQYHAETCTAKPTYAAPTTSDVGGTTGVVWSNQPSYSLDQRFRALENSNTGTAGSGPCPWGDQEIDVTQAVNAWSGGHVTSGATRQGIVLQAVNETDTSQQKRFCSRNPSSNPDFSYCGSSAYVPVLSVTYTPELGSQSWYSTTDHRLNDRSQLSVNNDNGNLVVSGSDVQVNARGFDMALGRTYNSQATEKSTLGNGWSLSLGPDVWLEAKSAYRVDYHSPTGAVMGSFVRKSSNTASSDYNKFTTPRGGVGADLTQSGNEYTLNFRSSQTKYVFTDNAAGNSHAYLTKVKDRSDNAMTVSYSGATSAGVPKMSQITDAAARTYAVTYSGDKVTKVAASATGVGTREWSYGYSGDYLTSYTDPTGATTDYDYTGAVAGPDLLTKVTDPVNNSAARPVTEVTYDYNLEIKVNEVQEVSYRHGSGADDTYKYTWDYNADIVPDCESKGDHSTVVTDPNDSDTTYCFQERAGIDDNAKTWVYDALGHARSTEYSADNGPTNITTPTGQGAGPTGSTAIQYSDSFTDRVDQVTEPKNSGSGKGVSAGLEYEVGGTSAGGSYLPSAVRTGTNDCNRYGYDGAGRTTAAYTGIAANLSTGKCGNPSTADGEFHTDYNDDGTTAKTWDANSGDDPTDADKTIYTYWKTGDSGFVAGTEGQVKTVRKPGGDCSTGAGRSLCSSNTYDGAGRVASITDGRGLVTNYTYDKNDRTTAVHFNNGNAATCLLGLSTCLGYTYDAEGNLTTRTGGQTTTFTHDRLNRMVQQSISAETVGGNDVIGMAYDGVGNLTSFTQTLATATATHEVTYGYDEANRLNRVTEGGEDISINTDDDGRTQLVKFPNPTGTDGAQVAYDYAANGRPKEQRIETHAGTQTGKIAYNYAQQITIAGITLTVDTQQLQSRNVSQSTFADQQGTTSYTYAKQRLTDATDTGGTDYAYTYDKVGNITQEDAGSATTHYGYDRAGQLCWSGPNTGTKLAQACPSTPSGDTNISQDAAGNSLGSTADPYTVNDRNQVTDIDDTTMAYTDQGNDLRANNGSNREVNSPLGISAVRNGTSITYLVRDPSGTILSSRTGTTRMNFVTEPNGNVSWLLNPAGTQVAGYKYAPYGSTTGYGGTTADVNRFRWLSAPQNTTSTGDDGHYKLGARYNDTRGHFTQPDPITGGLGDPRTLTAYNYAGGDPINSADPSGYCAVFYSNPTGSYGDSFACRSAAQAQRDARSSACAFAVAGTVFGGVGLGAAKFGAGVLAGLNFSQGLVGTAASAISLRNCF